MRTAAKSLFLTLVITTIATSHAYAEIAWQSNLRSAHAQAQQEEKLLLLHFYTDNCAWCDRLEAGSFRAPQVNQAIDRSFVPVKIHAGENPKLAKMFKVTRFPTDVVVTTEGQTLVHKVSPQDPERYVAMLVGSLPGLAATKVANAGVNSSQPAPNQVASSPSTPAAATPASSSIPESSAASAAAPVPGYAVAPSPASAPGNGSQATIEMPTQSKPENGFTVPDMNLADSLVPGPQAQMAAARLEGLSLQMPEQSTPEATTADAEAPQGYTVPPVGKDSALDASAASNVAPQSEDFNASVAASKPLVENDPELAMQGFCPVTVIAEDKWVEGKVDFGVIHLGKLYLFSNEQNMQTFLADPVPYTPVLNGIDVVRFFEERKIVQGKREWGLKDPIYNRMFFFEDEAAMNHFYEQYERYTDAAIEVMDKAVKDANPGS